MQINQRYDICREEGIDQKIDSKVYSNYRNHLQRQFQDTSLSFDSIQTPGWTSLVATEQSKTSHLTRNHQPNHNPHNQILTRLKSLPKLNNQQFQFSNIRQIPSSAKNKNVFIYGSIKEEQKKRMETPKSKQSKSSLKKKPMLISQSSKKSNSSNRTHEVSNPNQFSYSINKPKIFFSLTKNPQANHHQDFKHRVSSARSQSSLKLKDQINERLSLGNYKKKNITSQFESNIKTEPNQQRENSALKLKSQSKFYTQIHSLNPIREDKYMNRYLQKLNQRTKSSNSVKIFKKANHNNENEKAKTIKQIPNPSNTQSLLPLSLKRFNSITIHDHLYQKGVQMQIKKEVQRMVDQSYQKANILTFSPFISEKSHFLAESKFSRQANVEYSSANHGEMCFIKGHKVQSQSQPLKDNIFTIQQQVAIKQKENMAEKQRNQSLIKLFKLLSNKTNEINDKNMQANIQKLPLSLLQILEPLLTQIYKKDRFDERRFIEVFSTEGKNSIKQIASKRHLVVTQTQRLIRFLQRSQQQQEQKQNKENFIGTFNLNHKEQPINYNK